MSTIPAKTIERNRHNSQRSESWACPTSKPHLRRRRRLLLRLGRRHMRVKLCARCPYAPRGLAGHYDPEAALHVCAKCDSEQGVTTNHYPRETYRRRKCATIPNIFGTTQRSAAPSATESLVSSGTTPGELPSVQRNALIASRPARRATADGYADFEPPDHSCSENHAEIARRSEFRK